MALSVLRGCSSEHAEVRSVLSVLAPHIAECSEPLRALELSMALYGLRGCSSEHAEVRSVLTALAPHIAKCSKTLSAQERGHGSEWSQRLQQRARRGVDPSSQPLHRR